VLVPFLSLLISAAPVVGPLGVVKAADAEVQRVLAAKETDAAQKLAARADLYIDFTELARRALGQDWAGLSRAQREAFTSTMKRYLRASYAKNALGSGRGNARVEYGAETVEAHEATVATTLALKEERVPVVYKLFQADGRQAWKIYDVVTDDVSLVTTYNDQFRKVIAKSGFDGLLRSLKARLAQLEKGETAAK
jgi:phospholipid transport system substrate-binding protein